MEVIKKKMAVLKQKLEEAENEANQAEQELEETNAKADEKEQEAEDLTRALSELEDQFDSAESRNQALNERLVKAEANLDTRETTSRPVEPNQGDSESTKQARLALEEKQTMLRDAERRLVVMNRDLERTQAKADALNKRAGIMDDNIHQADLALKNLEERESNHSAREEGNSETLTLLNGQIKEAEVRFESAERQCNVLERTINDTEVEIDTWVKKREEIEREMSEMGR